MNIKDKMKENSDKKICFFRNVRISDWYQCMISNFFVVVVNVTRINADVSEDIDIMRQTKYTKISCAL